MILMRVLPRIPHSLYYNDTMYIFGSQNFSCRSLSLSGCEGQIETLEWYQGAGVRMYGVPKGT